MVFINEWSFLCCHHVTQVWNFSHLISGCVCGQMVTSVSVQRLSLVSDANVLPDLYLAISHLSWLMIFDLFTYCTYWSQKLTSVLKTLFSLVLCCDLTCKHQCKSSELHKVCFVCLFFVQMGFHNNWCFFCTYRKQLHCSSCLSHL